VVLFNRIYGLNTTVLRYFHVYGPRQESNEFGGVVSIFIRNMLQGERPVIFGDGTQERSFTYVKDVVKANFLAATEERTAGEIYNCASGISVTIKELCDQVIRYFGMEGKVEPLYEDWVIGDIKVFDISNEKLKQVGMTFDTDFGRRLEETITDMRDYLSEK
jgi:UDP-glucose 4-epimerase